jgi:hypothetical protein
MAKLFSWLNKPIPPMRDWWLSGVIEDESGSPSAKRVMGLVSGVALVFSLIWNVINPESKVDENLVNSLMVICVGCLGLSTADKFSPSAQIHAEADVKAAEEPTPPEVR